MFQRSNMFKVVKQSLIVVASLFSGLSIHSTAFADSTTTTVGRYLSVQNQAPAAQTDLLQQTFQVKFPLEVKTIGDAMHYLLRFSGYSLVDNKNLSLEAQAILVQPLPQVDRCLGPISLQEGLLTLAGKPFGLLIDPVHRLISFRLKPEFQSLYRSNIHT